MKLFRYEAYSLTISEEALLLKPIRKIWKRDRSDGKKVAMLELGYIYFMEDPRSDYMMYMDRETRDRQIREGEGIPDDWKPDAAVKDAMEFYAGFKSDASMLLEDTKRAVKQIRDRMNDIVIDDSLDVMTQLNALDKLTSITTKVPKLSLELMEAEKRMNDEIRESSKIRGSSEKSMFEDD